MVQHLSVRLGAIWVGQICLSWLDCVFLNLMFGRSLSLPDCKAKDCRFADCGSAILSRWFYQHLQWMGYAKGQHFFSVLKSLYYTSTFGGQSLPFRTFSLLAYSETLLVLSLLPNHPHSAKARLPFLRPQAAGSCEVHAHTRHTMVTSIQDRTNEFKSILAQAQKRQTVKPPQQRQSLLSDQQKQEANGDAAPRSARSQFARDAATIGRGITATMGKLERLAQRMDLSADI